MGPLSRRRALQLGAISTATATASLTGCLGYFADEATVQVREVVVVDDQTADIELFRERWRDDRRIAVTVDDAYRDAFEPLDDATVSADLHRRLRHEYQEVGYLVGVQWDENDALNEWRPREEFNRVRVGDTVKASGRDGELKIHSVVEERGQEWTVKTQA
ncbi:hypothetical protein [Haloarchaeobius sp. DT45]|uniref:hypothetical protein n=1 Tax=Haloarchaeobius sp. DT45 TaxID=3446116 RepID=UPI003F6AB226